MANERWGDIKAWGSDTGTPISLAKRINIVNDMVPIRGLKVLDAGCGGGAFVERMLELGADVWGIEFLDEKVAEWHARHPNDDRVRTGDLANLDFVDGAFDIIFMNEVLEHTPDDSRVLAEMRRVLKVGGLFFNFTPNRLYPIELHGVIFRRSGQHVSGLRFPFAPWLPLSISRRIIEFPARNYWPRELLRMTREAGFTVLSQRYVWQTFEGLEGKRHGVKSQICWAARLVAGILEKTFGLKIFGCSQLVIARK
ncbi:MAG: methyltransferase domain-containing protein [Pseudomonadota bacterium]|nr:methyltransferase domain-containing protein [Pseudomonadota bacterium]